MATIVMSADKVIEAAEQNIARIRAKRKAQDEDSISNYINNSAPGRLYKLLGFKPTTREQAISKLRAVSWGFFPSQYAWGDLEHSKKLLILAKHGDPVTLNEKDTQVLFG